MNILILAIGSPHGDDQLAWLASEQLYCNKLLDSTIHIECVDRPGLNLLYWFEETYDAVILMDAVLNQNSQPGEIFQLPPDKISAFQGMLSSHNLGVAPSIALAEVLNLLPKHCYFFGMQAKNTGINEPLSSEIKNNICRLCHCVEQHLQLLATYHHRES